jgi:hypothetical protein
MRYLLFNENMVMDDVELDLGKAYYSFCCLYLPLPLEQYVYKSIPEFQNNKPFGILTIPHNLTNRRGVTITKNGYMNITLL